MAFVCSRAGCSEGLLKWQSTEHPHPWDWVRKGVLILRLLAWRNFEEDRRACSWWCSSPSPASSCSENTKHRRYRGLSIRTRQRSILQAATQHLLYFGFGNHVGKHMSAYTICTSMKTGPYVTSLPLETTSRMSHVKRMVTV